MIQRRKINRIQSELKTYCSLRAGEGEISRQSYNSASGETYPDRRLTPLTLTPEAGYTDPDTGMSVANARPFLTEGHWYRLDNSTEGRLTPDTEITNQMTTAAPDGSQMTRFDINTTIGSTEYGEIKIYENVQAGNPVTYVFQALLVVPGRKSTLLTARYSCKTEAVETLPELSFDNNTQGLYNPLNGARYFTINPIVTPVGLTATFAWESWHEDGGWENLGDTLRDWAVERVGNGVKIDRKYMPDHIRLRCTATVDVGDVQVQVSRILTHQRRMPKLTVEMSSVGDLPPDAKEINPRAVVKAEGCRIVENTDEVRIPWYGSGTAEVAEGIQPQIALSKLGADMELGVDAKDRGGFKYLTLDGQYLTLDGKILIIR